MSKRKTHLTLPSYVWVGGGNPLASWAKVPEGETLAAFLCLFCLTEPPQRKTFYFYFLLRLCSMWKDTGEHAGREARGSDILRVGRGYDPLPHSVRDATALLAHE